MNTGAKVFVLLRANCCTSYYSLMTSFTPIPNERIGTRKINGGAKFSEIKVLKCGLKCLQQIGICQDM